jgi:tetratricopeptide (TPR) repeat protein
MKGIVVHNLGKKQEGLELVKKGTRLNMASHICWHVSALVYRAERDLEQALSCYLQAIKCDRVRLVESFCHFD